MHQTKYVFYLLMLVLMFNACIKPYEPEIQTIDLKKYVINGTISDADALQKLNISMTSAIGDPQYLPITACNVVISDNKGNTFFMDDAGNGNYTTWINQSSFIPGVAFKVDVITPDGTHIVSDFDTLTECPAIDSVYFRVEDIPDNIPGVFTQGIQFYLDLDATSVKSHYFRWEAIETWEYHATYPLEWWYDGVIHHVVPPDYSNMVCWSTRLIPEIYTISTNNLVENKYHMLPLHFVSNRTSRLAYGYSLLIKQFALSELAYIYWDKLRINSDQQGGLYEKQPLAIKGNMHNLSNPESEVLGFFSVASLRTKRLFIHDVPNLPLDYYTYCSPSALWKGLQELTPSRYPAYLMGDALTYYLIELNVECINCTILGGSNVKPDFWPY
ncbi:MAG: DUF4249 domain-containing protein [Bacteroidales bacterium]|nr:DUF4249 domain-containing protein [Bacteroidales bacterium]